MQERCVRKCFREHRLWLPGEVRLASEKDDDGNVVASMHFRLLEEDESVNPRDVYDEAEVKKAKRESGMRDKRAVVTAALYELDPDDDSHWTRAGDPSIKEVFSRTDLEVSRQEIRAIAPDFDRRKARELQA